MVELDDVAEKARRNLMVMAIGIIMVAALGIPLDGKLVGAVDLSQVEPWRAWTCALTGLVYFYLRFRLAPTYSRSRIDYRQTKSQERYQAKSRFVESQYEKKLRGEPTLLSFSYPDPPPGKYIPGVNANLQSVRVGKFARRGQQGTIRFIWNYAESPKLPSDKRDDASFVLPWSWLAEHYMRDHWARVRHISWQGLDVTLPTMLACAAAGVCIWKLWVSLYNSFPFIRQLLPA